MEKIQNIDFCVSCDKSRGPERLARHNLEGRKSLNSILDQHFPLPVGNGTRTVLFLVEYSKSSDQMKSFRDWGVQTLPGVEITALDLDSRLPPTLTTPAALTRLLNTYLLPFRRTRTQHTLEPETDDDLASLASTTIDEETIFSIVEGRILAQHVDMQAESPMGSPQTLAVVDVDTRESLRGTSPLTSLPSDPGQLAIDDERGTDHVEPLSTPTVHVVEECSPVPQLPRASTPPVSMLHHKFLLKYFFAEIWY